MVEKIVEKVIDEIIPYKYSLEMSKLELGGDTYNFIYVTFYVIMLNDYLHEFRFQIDVEDLKSIKDIRTKIKEIYKTLKVEINEVQKKLIEKQR